MMIFETFSQRQQKTAQAEQPEVYRYDDLPKVFRAQVILIWRSIAEHGDTAYSRQYSGSHPYTSSVWKSIRDLYVRKIGDLTLTYEPFSWCCEHLLRTDNFGAIDLIDLAFTIMDRIDKSNSNIYTKNNYSFEDGVHELNHRFREHAIGYQFEGAQLIRIDSQYVHEVVTKPALVLLHDPAFQGPSEEFLRAHAHYRAGDLHACIVEALKAFESTMKAICIARGWIYDSNDTAQRLISILMTNGLVPTYLQNQLTHLRGVLESGAPTVRNKSGGHGQGATPIIVPLHLAAYALHLTAANIVFLIEAHNALP